MLGHGGARPNSGRPLGGVNKSTAEIRHLLSPSVAIAVARLQKMFDSADDRVALQAIELLFNYSYGKPRHAVDPEVEHQRQITAEQLEALQLDDEQLKRLAGIG